MKRAPLALAALLAVTGIVWAAYFLPGGLLPGGAGKSLPSAPMVAAQQLEALYATALPDLDGHIQTLTQWRGKVLVVNYWATWCAPCREEMPMFSKLHDHYAASGVQFVGIALDDADKVRGFVRETPVSYPLLVGGNGAIKPTLSFGNAPQAVPFTIVLDREGGIHTAKLGRVHEDDLTRLLDDLVQNR